jgi:thiol-disulfide isomerase/thioredoxin
MLAALLSVVFAAALQPSPAAVSPAAVSPATASQSTASQSAASALARGDIVPVLNGLTPDGKTAAADWSIASATVVIFFATWCKPCHRALRELREIGQTTGPRVRFVLIDAGDDPAKARQFIADNSIPEAAVVIGDPSGSEKDRWGCPILPTLFIVDQAGIVRYINHGWGDGSAAKYLRRVQNVLGDSAPQRKRTIR